MSLWPSMTNALRWSSAAFTPLFYLKLAAPCIAVVLKSAGDDLTARRPWVPAPAFIEIATEPETQGRLLSPDMHRTSTAVGRISTESACRVSENRSDTRFGGRSVSGIVGRSVGSGGDLRRRTWPHHGDRADALPYPSTGAVVRLSVRLRRARLDRQLAAGTCPTNDSQLTLRAWQLVQSSSRRRVALALRRTVREAHGDRRTGLSSVVSVSRKAVTQWSEGLLGLADAIERSDRASACGIARALELITDGRGPLYNPAAADLLGTAVWSIADGLHGHSA